MADTAETSRQEKLAAARKRVEQMKKKKSKQSATNKREGAEDKKDDIEGALKTSTANDVAVLEREEDDILGAKDVAAVDTGEEDQKHAAADDNVHDPLQSASPSLAQQSKMRSTSFRAGSATGPEHSSPNLFSPEGDTVPDIYRKHVARIEELERENKRLAKEAADAEKRWKKTEEELLDLREGDSDSTGKNKLDEDAKTKLETEIASLQRQNAQLQQQVSRGSAHAHRGSVSATATSDVQAEMNSKVATIEFMEIEISKLKAQLHRQESGASSEKEQIAALEERLARAEAAAGKAQRELQDVKRNLERATEKAVREGGERSSAETKLQNLSRELAELKQANEILEQSVEKLEKKVTTLTTLHKEQDARSQALRREKEQAEKSAADLRRTVQKLENEATELGEGKSSDGGGLDDEGVDELEGEVRLRLRRKIRSLEEEVHELRSGAWIARRREMETMGAGFQEIDLTSPAHRKASGGAGGGGSIGELLTSGLNALAGSGTGASSSRQGGGDGLLLDDDGSDFDEEAFRRAQEEDARRRIERIKEIKRSLKRWEGWRLDLVDARRGGGEGIGDIFEV